MTSLEGNDPLNQKPAHQIVKTLIYPLRYAHRIVLDVHDFSGFDLAAVLGSQRFKLFDRLSCRPDTSENGLIFIVELVSLGVEFKARPPRADSVLPQLGYAEHQTRYELGGRPLV